MRLMVLTAMLALFAGPVAAEATDPRQALVTAAVEQVIIPGYESLARSAQVLDQAAQALCAAPSGDALSAARDAFAGTVTAWSRIEFVQFGPVRAENRLERILFFPDRKGIALKQLQGWLAEPAAEAPTVADMATRSAALQGLPALEFVLHGTGADDLAAQGESRWRCKVGAAIAGNLAAITLAIAADWKNPDGIRAQLENPGAGNPLYHDSSEALAQVLKVLPNGYELMVETRLRPFLGETAETARPKAALFWRSGLTARSLAGNVEGLAALAGTQGLMDGLPDDVRDWVPNNLAFETGQALAILDAAKAPLGEEAATADGHARLVQLARQLDNLREIASTGIMGGYGLASGFSSLDGD